MRNTVLIIGLQLAMLPAFAQQSLADPKFIIYNGENGFAPGFIGNIMVDSKGYLWAASLGLYKYDGNTVEHFTNFNNQQHGLRHNYTDDILEDKWGRIWIGNAAGLCYYSYETRTFKYLDDPEIPIQFAYSFLIADNKLWFVSDLGLCNVDLATLQLARTKLTDARDPICSFRAYDGTIYISTRSRFFCYDPKKDTAFVLSLLAGKRPVRIRKGIEVGNKIFLATNAGIFLLHNRSMVQMAGTGDLDIVDILQAPGNPELLWIATRDDGIRIFNSRSLQVERSYRHEQENPFSIPADNVTTLYADAQKRIWVATENGVAMFDSRSQAWKQRLVNGHKRLAGDNQVQIARSDRYNSQQAWVSCKNQGIFLYDWTSKKVLKQFEDFPASTGLNFVDMEQVNRTEWLLLTPSGLVKWDCRLNQVSMVHFSYTDPIQPVEFRDIIPVGNGIYFIASSSGLFKYQFQENRMEQLTRSQTSELNRATDLVRGNSVKGQTWLASRKGIVCYDSTLRTSKQYFYKSVRDDDHNNFLFDIITTGRYVIAASARGLLVLDTITKKLSLVEQFGSFHNPSCYGLFEVNNIIWINSNAGILSYNLHDGSTTYQNTGQSKTGSSTMPISAVNEDLVIGFRNLFFYFVPSGLTETFKPAGIRIEQVLINNESVPEQNSFSLRYHQSSISFKYTAFNFTNPSQIIFRYKLEGFDDEWINAFTMRQASYINLPPGKYRFLVQAGDLTGRWHDELAFANIRIRPPFWKTWWFVPFLFALIIAGIFYSSWRKIRRVKNEAAVKTQEARKIAEMQNRLLRNQMNPHFIFNSLNSIQKYIWENREEDAAEYLASFAKLMRSILNNSAHDVVTLEEEMDFIKLYISLEHRRCTGHFDYSVQTDPSIDLSTLYVPPMLLQPFVENAIWHGLSPQKENGFLTVTVKKKSNQLIYAIEDNGHGRRPEKRQVSGQAPHAIEMTRQRLELINKEYPGKAHLSIIDKTEGGKPAGTFVQIFLPLMKK